MLKSLRNSSDALRRHPGLAAVSKDGEHGNALFEALVCEFHWTALQVGAVTSCINASVSQNRSWMMRSCGNLIPVESPSIKAGLRAWQEIDLPRELAASISGIYRDLSDAKRLTLPIILAAGAFTAPKISEPKLQQIAALWKKLSEDCESAVQELEPEARWRLGGLYTGNALLLGKFVRDAISGSYDCVNQIGEVAIPVLPQRRKTARYILLQPCKIRGADGSSIALAHDISRNGLELTCERSFSVKERVRVELRSGRKFSGIVVWTRQKLVNIQFDDALASDDPLFTR